MALPDAPNVVPHRRQRPHRERTYAVLAAAAVGAVAALWMVEISLGAPVVVSGLTDTLSLAAGLLVVAWLIAAAERRVVARLERLEGERYRDGYAAGYVDAASQARERPSLRPVR